MSTTAGAVERPGPVTVWFAVIVGPVTAWIAHLLAVASLVRLTCDEPRWRWAPHAATAVTLAVTAFAMLVSVRLTRSDHGASGVPDAPDAATRLRFLGYVGISVGAFNAALIIVEELLIVGFHGHACG